MAIYEFPAFLVSKARASQSPIKELEMTAATKRHKISCTLGGDC